MGREANTPVPQQAEGTERLVKFQISSRRNRYAYINILCGRTTREIGTRAPSRVRLINFIFLCHPFSSNRAEGVHIDACVQRTTGWWIYFPKKWYTSCVEFDRRLFYCWLDDLKYHDRFFHPLFLRFFFFFYYEDMIRSIWKVIQFFPVAGNIYDDIVIRGRLLCNSCGWRWNLLRIFDIETIDKSVWVKLVTRSNLIWIYKSEFRLTSDTSISEFNTKSFENLLLKSLLWYVFYESNLL